MKFIFEWLPTQQFYSYIMARTS